MKDYVVFPVVPMVCRGAPEAGAAFGFDKTLPIYLGALRNGKAKTSAGAQPERLL
jgi:hypothetical protein